MQGHSRPTFGWPLVTSVLNSLIFTADKCPTPILCLLTRICWMTVLKKIICKRPGNAVTLDGKMYFHCP